MLLQQFCLLFGLIFCLSSAREVPVKGFQIIVQFQCNGLPLIGTVHALEKVELCSEINLHLDIPDRETVLELLEPFSGWNASFHIACGQSEHLFTDQAPVVTVFHNCPPPALLSNESSSVEESAVQQQHQEEVCKKWQIEVPAENIGLKAPVLDLGVAELSGLGDAIECRQGPPPQLISQEEQQQVEEFKEENADNEIEIPAADEEKEEAEEVSDATTTESSPTSDDDEHGDETP